MKFRAAAAPSGAAARLILGMPAGGTPLVIATLSSTPPDPNALGAGDRIVIDATTPLAPSTWPFEARATHGLTYHQYLDLDTSLAGTITHYHAWVTSGTGSDGPITQEVDARAPTRTAVVSVVRDLIRARLDYHLTRAVASNRLRPRSGYVPILQVEALHKDDPLPCLLMKEALSPTNLEGIGKHRGERTAANGDRYVEEVHRYRCRIDLLALSENPEERTILANVVHEALLVDRTLLEDAGMREPTMQRLMRSATTPEGRWQFAEDISLDSIVEAVTEERMQYRVPGTTTFFNI
jgi:hypothetical protein